MMPETGYTYKTKNNLHTNHCYPTVGYSRLGASYSRRSRQKAELSWPPSPLYSWPLYLYSKMSKQHTPTQSVPNAVNLIPEVAALPLARNATTTMALCKKPWSIRNPQDRYKDSRAWPRKSSSHKHSISSTSRGRQSQQCMSHSLSINCSHHRSLHHSAQRSTTPYRHQVSHITLITSQSSQEGKLIADTESDGHTSFQTMLQ